MLAAGSNRALYCEMEVVPEAFWKIYKLFWYVQPAVIEQRKPKQRTQKVWGSGHDFIYTILVNKENSDPQKS